MAVKEENRKEAENKHFLLIASEFHYMKYDKKKELLKEFSRIAMGDENNNGAIINKEKIEADRRRLKRLMKGKII